MPWHGSTKYTRTYVQFTLCTMGGTTMHMHCTHAMVLDIQEGL